MLAEKRLHVTLWPAEPVPEQWKGISDLEPLPTIESITAAAKGTEERLAQIRARYGIAQIGEQRSELLIRNYLHVAKTGDYAQTNGPVYEVLAARGILRCNCRVRPRGEPWQSELRSVCLQLPRRRSGCCPRHVVVVVE